MKARAPSRRGKLRAAYTVPELAELLGLSRWQTLRVLRHRRVPLDRIGRVHLVWISTLRELVPALFESLIAVRRAARASTPTTGTAPARRAPAPDTEPTEDEDDAGDDRWSTFGLSVGRGADR